MAKKTAVWGIDIGNSSLKALRCQVADEPGKIEATAFDFIEHSKILSQPGAEPAEILAETIKTFLSRNKTKGDKVAISVSGQNTISRFLKLPPVDPKKIPDIIKYEAKQWLPFDLNDVIWGFQPIGTAEQSMTAVPVDSEIGMFAMKRDIAMKTLAPYLHNAIDVDCIQSSPLAIYNFTAFDQLATQNIEVFEPDNPPDSLIILCVGTDATDVVITNGFSIWIRSIPIGGSVFTKALTKGLKLTFSKAEYLKRNAAAAQDPKAVFQAMKPVFNDMLSEVHRSIEYYQSLNRKVKFSKILALGNAIKMPGLRQFLTQNLGYEVTRLTQFNRLVGTEVIDAPLFKDNILSFGVSYGLALQQLDEAPLKTNLIPKEIVTDRIVREKKPWVLVAVATILLGLVFQFAGATSALKGISVGGYGDAENKAKTVQTYAAKMKSDTSTAVTAFKDIDTIGHNLTSNIEGRIIWLELLRAIDIALPKDQAPAEGTQPATEQEKLKALEKQNRIFITNVEAVTVDSLTEWFEPLKENKRYYPDDEEVAEALASGAAPGGNDAASSSTSGSSASSSTASTGTTTDATTSADGTAPKKLSELTESERMALIAGPTAELAEGTVARVVQLVGYHYHNPDDVAALQGSDYLRRTLLRNLKFGEVILPSTLEKQMKAPNIQSARDIVTMQELGISYPTLLDIAKIQQTEMLNPRVVLEIIKEERKNALNKKQRSGGFGGGGGAYNGGTGGGGSYSGRNDPSMSVMQSYTNPFEQSSSSGMTDGRTTSGEDYIRFIAKKMSENDKILLRRFDFVVQFAWIETPPSVREKKREAARLVAAEAAAAVEQSAASTAVNEAAAESVAEETTPAESTPTETETTPETAEPPQPAETPVAPEATLPEIPAPPPEIPATPTE